MNPPAPRRGCRLVLVSSALAIVLLLLLHGAPARGADAFEIQVYDGTANAAGVAGLELHVNDAVDGARTAPAPELPPHHLLHLTLEPSLGVTDFWELGAYFQVAVRPDEGSDVAGGKLRSKLVTPPAWHPHLRLGINAEVGYLKPRYAAERWGAELRPIVAYEDERWHLAANPIVGLALTGGGPTFEPAAMALVKIRDVVSLGLEYYADLGAIFPEGGATEREHVLFEVLNLLSLTDVELNLGIGEGLSAGSSPLVAKLVAGYSFARGRGGERRRSGW
jgi:hypothetical protein